MTDNRVAFPMPSLGNGVDTAIINRWLVGVGEQVQQGDPIVTIETDKATSDLEAPVTGTLVVVHAQDGVEVEIGDLLAEFKPSAEA